MSIRHASWIFACTTVVSVLVTGPAAWCNAFVPSDDAQILERLPFKPTDADALELRALRRALAHEPNNLALAQQVARRDIEQTRRDSDPRYLGYAQAALAPWWNLLQPPVPVRVLRATVHQANHQFDSALTDLDAALRQQPGNAQALLTRAAVLQARGDYAGAMRSCRALVPVTDPIVSYTCLCTVTGLNGSAEKSYTLLQRFMERAPSTTAEQRQWLEGVLAEMAARRGTARAAQRHFQNALAAGPADGYLLTAYADFLLDTGRASDVVALLRDQTRADPLLLRLALAEQVLRLPTLNEHIAALRARFEASRLRGDVVHRREEARFELALLNHPATALRLARDNWTVQREPADARILLQSALAAGAPQDARPVIDWLDQTRLEDVQLAPLAQRLRTRAP